MTDHLALLLALRTRLLTLSVATTGSATLSATATGYARVTGSFLADGFAVGMEVTPSGFATTGNNGARTLTGVTATALTCAGCAVEAATTATIACGLPALRVWENVAFTPEAGRPWIEEDYLAGPVAQVTLGARGDVETLPLYVVKLYGPAGAGVGALYRTADALLALFAPRTALTTTGGDVVRVRSDPAPYRGQLRQAAPGWAVVPVTIPLSTRTPNTI